MKPLRYSAMLAAALALALSLGCSDDDNPPVSVDSTAPAGVTDLAIVSVAANSITLRWTAPGDDGNTGTADSYVIKQSPTALNGANFGAATPLSGVPAPSAAGAIETFTVTPFDTLAVTHFAMRAKDEQGNLSPVSNDVVWLPEGVKTLIPYLDNTLYEESDTLSNALGEHFYSSMNNQGASAPIDARRGLLAFAIADSIPAGATIDSVALVLNLSKKAPFVPGNSPVSLHVLVASWGEGTSIADIGPGEGGGGSATPGDATWLDRFRGTSLWTNPGGDFSAGASATVQTNALGKYTWTSATMVSDVQNWLDNPASNFGWIVIGDESVSAGNARQWDSRQNPNVANRPRLIVFYTAGP